MTGSIADIALKEREQLDVSVPPAGSLTERAEQWEAEERAHSAKLWECFPWQSVQAAGCRPATLDCWQQSSHALQGWASGGPDLHRLPLQRAHAL